MKRISVILTSLLAIVGFLFTASCSSHSDELLNSDAQQDGVHTYNLHLNAGAPDFDGAQSRATTTSWASGSVLYFRFGTVTGKATYDGSTWTFTTNSTLSNTSSDASCTAVYVENPASTSSSSITLNEESAVYKGTGTYTCSSGDIYVNINLSPVTARMRFKGSSGTQIELPSDKNDISYPSSISLSTLTLTSAKSNVSLTVGSTGYTPYIYGTLTNTSGNNTIYVKNISESNDYQQTSFSGTKLPVGSSGYLTIPTNGNYGSLGWSKIGGGQSGDSNQIITANGISFTMVYVQGGTFTMGATSEQGSDAYSDESPTHSVTLSDYYIGQTEVTQALWQAVMGSNPSSFSGNNLPVETVSWNDCQTFVSKLNTLTGKNFSLPTEAQWEFAARGGNKSKVYKYSGSNIIGDVAWYYDNLSNKTHDVGTKSPNELGIYDMSGNVCEWCQDWYGGYGSSAQTNPTGPSSGSYRVLRGGSWGSDARYCRVSRRDYSAPDFRLNCFGLRLALIPSDQPYQPGAGTNNNNGHEYVDLGLSVKWATCNIGASKPEEYGDYFAWGDTSPKSNYSWETHSVYGKYFYYDEKITLELADDAAYQNWGGYWRMPTKAELDELCTKCTWIWSTVNGVYGCKVVGPNGNSIFLPAAGYRNDSDLDAAGSYGYYWSSEREAGTQKPYAYRLFFDSVGVSTNSDFSFDGKPVRAVCP